MHLLMDWHLLHLPRKLSTPLPVLWATGQYVSEGPTLQSCVTRMHRYSNMTTVDVHRQNGWLTQWFVQSCTQSWQVAYITGPSTEPFLHVTRLGPLLPSKTWTTMHSMAQMGQQQAAGTTFLFDSHSMHLSTHTLTDRPVNFAHFECKPDCQLVVEHLAPLPPLLRYGWRLAELPAGAAALPVPVALQEDPAPAQMDTVVMMCHQYAASHDVLSDREYSYLWLTDCIQVVQLVEERIQCLTNKMQRLSKRTDAKIMIYNFRQ